MLTVIQGSAAIRHRYYGCNWLSGVGLVCIDTAYRYHIVRQSLDNGKRHIDCAGVVILTGNDCLCHAHVDVVFVGNGVICIRIQLLFTIPNLNYRDNFLSGVMHTCYRLNHISGKSLCCNLKGSLDCTVIVADAGNGYRRCARIGVVAVCNSVLRACGQCSAAILNNNIRCNCAAGIGQILSAYGNGDIIVFAQVFPANRDVGNGRGLTLIRYGDLVCIQCHPRRCKCEIAAVIGIVFHSFLCTIVINPLDLESTGVKFLTVYVILLIVSRGYSAFKLTCIRCGECCSNSKYLSVIAQRCFNLYLPCFYICIYAYSIICKYVVVFSCQGKACSICRATKELVGIAIPNIGIAIPNNCRCGIIAVHVNVCTCVRRFTLSGSGQSCRRRADLGRLNSERYNRTYYSFVVIRAIDRCLYIPLTDSVCSVPFRKYSILTSAVGIDCIFRTKLSGYAMDRGRGFPEFNIGTAKFGNNVISLYYLECKSLSSCFTVSPLVVSGICQLQNYIVRAYIGATFVLSNGVKVIT